MKVSSGRNYRVFPATQRRGRCAPRGGSLLPTWPFAIRPRACVCCEIWRRELRCESLPVRFARTAQRAESVFLPSISRARCSVSRAHVGARKSPRTQRIALRARVTRAAGTHDRVQTKNITSQRYLNVYIEGRRSRVRKKKEEHRCDASSELKRSFHSRMHVQ